MPLRKSAENPNLKLSVRTDGVCCYRTPCIFFVAVVNGESMRFAPDRLAITRNRTEVRCAAVSTIIRFEMEHRRACTIVDRKLMARHHPPIENTRRFSGFIKQGDGS